MINERTKKILQSIIIHSDDKMILWSVAEQETDKIKDFCKKILDEECF